MKMLYCRKCGAPVISGEAMAQEILDRITDAAERAKRGPNRRKLAALAEAAEYRSVYKSLMHNITQKEYADAVAPEILRELTAEIRARKLLTEDEIGSIYDRAKESARAKSKAAEREIERLYGRFETESNKTVSDPTADAAISRLDGGRAGGNKA